MRLDWDRRSSQILELGANAAVGDDLNYGIRVFVDFYPTMKQIWLNFALAITIFDLFSGLVGVIR
jgi:hypothetical protein